MATKTVNKSSGTYSRIPTTGWFTLGMSSGGTNQNAQIVFPALNVVGVITSIKLYVPWNNGSADEGYSAAGDIVAKANGISHTITMSGSSGTAVFDFTSGGISNSASTTVDLRAVSGESDGTSKGCDQDVYIIVTYTEYTDCTAPTAFTASPSVFNGGGAVTLSWSGAAAGTNNAIKGYQIQYRVSWDNGATWTGWYDTLPTTQTSTALSVVDHPANQDGGTKVNYQIRTLGAAGSSYYSGWKAGPTITFNSNPKVPILVAPTVENTVIGAYTVDWNAAAAPTDPDNNFHHYEIQVCTANASKVWGSWAAYTTTTATVLSLNTSSWTEGPLYYKKYRIRAVDALGLASAWIETAAIRKGQPITAPGALSPSARVVNTSIALAWGAATLGDGSTKYYDVQVSINGGAYSTVYSTTGLSYTLDTSSYAEGASIAVRIQARDINTSAVGTAITYTKNTKPPTPTIVNKDGGICYSKRPVFMVNIPADTDNQTLTLTAKIDGSTSSLAISTNSIATGHTTIKRTADLAVGAHTFEVYTNDGMVNSLVASIDFTIANPPAIMIAGLAGSKIEDQDIIDFRTMVNNVHLFYRGVAVTWSPANPVRGTKVSSVYSGLMTSMRTAIQNIINSINGWDSATTTNNVSSASWATIANGRAANMNEIRTYIINNL